MIIKITLIVILLTLLIMLSVPKVEKMNDDNLDANKFYPSTNREQLSEGPMDLNDLITDDYLIRQYDIRKTFDPLEEPTRRVPRHELPTMEVRRLIDFPTRGYPDTFVQLGILKKDVKDNGENNIIRLFGRQ